LSDQPPACTQGAMRCVGGIPRDRERKGEPDRWCLQGPLAGMPGTRLSLGSGMVVVAVGIAFVGMGAIGTVIAFSAIERARMIAEEAITKPFRPPVPKAEYRLSDQQQLQRIFLGR
jgi:hypothetical protein